MGAVMVSVNSVRYRSMTEITDPVYIQTIVFIYN